MSTTSATLSRSARVPVFVVLLLLALTIAYPILYLGISAFRSKSDYLADPFGLPAAWTFDNFVSIWNNYSIGQAFVNSVSVIVRSCRYPARRGSAGSSP
jgi:ABC-type glycerol-3-phosphate transport system permease component